MRRFINLEKNRQIELSSKFPDLHKLYCVEDSCEYSAIAISIFDHWLSREEYQNDNPDKNEISHRQNLLNSFSMAMAKDTELLNFTFRGKWQKCYPLFRKFASNEFKYSYLMPAGESYKSSKFFKIVLPELNAVFFESWDYTNIFYCRNTDVFPRIHRWAESSGVYCLEMK